MTCHKYRALFCCGPAKKDILLMTCKNVEYCEATCPEAHQISGGRGMSCCLLCLMSVLLAHSVNKTTLYPNIFDKLEFSQENLGPFDLLVYPVLISVKSSERPVSCSSSRVN